MCVTVVSGYLLPFILNIKAIYWHLSWNDGEQWRGRRVSELKKFAVTEWSACRDSRTHLEVMSCCSGSDYELKSMPCVPHVPPHRAGK